MSKAQLQTHSGRNRAIEIWEHGYVMNQSMNCFKAVQPDASLWMSHQPP